jgi:catalase (peroxidase I)
MGPEPAGAGIREWHGLENTRSERAFRRHDYSGIEGTWTKTPAQWSHRLF